MLMSLASEKAAEKNFLSTSVSSYGTRKTRTRCLTLFVDVSIDSTSGTTWNSIYLPVCCLTSGARDVNIAPRWVRSGWARYSHPALAVRVAWSGVGHR